MNLAAQEKLRALRQRLADLEPYPWEPVEAWIASAKPLIKAFYGAHCDDFLAVTEAPRWFQGAVWFSGGDFSGEPERSNLAEVQATAAREDPKRAATAKEKILGFLDGLLDLPPMLAQPASSSSDIPSGKIATLGDDANRIFSWLREEYIKAGYPNHKVWNFSPSSDARLVFNELRAHGYIKPFGLGNAKYLLTDLGQRLMIHPHQPSAEHIVNVHHHGDTHMGDKYTVTTTNSTIGAQAVGDNAHAQGTVNIGATGVPTQAQFDQHLKDAKKALVDDEDQLDDLVREALTQFLTMARKIQIDQQNLAQLQAKMKETLDEVWAQQAAKGLRPQALPEGLKVIETLAKNPITAEIAKKLLGA